MNILSIPSLVGGHSHLIPLFVFHQRYLRRLSYVNNFFLVGEQNKELLKASGINCVNLDYSVRSHHSLEKLRREIFAAEQESFDLIKPSIVIEDNCFTSPLISEKNGVPRISVQRTGFFRSIDNRYRREHHIHSAEKDDKGNRASRLLDFFHDQSQLNDSTPESKFLKQYLNAKTKIVPGIRSIEILPDSLSDDTSYFFAGPLTVKDNPSDLLIKNLEKFFEANRDRRKVFLTLGLIDNTPAEAYIDYLVEQEFCVITTVDYIVKKDHERPRVFQNKFLPLDIVSSSVDLIIHQCGSGIYHYPILNEKPAITLGTLCYDREDVAMVLQMKQVSKHVPHPKDNENHFEIFVECVDQFKNGRLCSLPMLLSLKREIHQTMLEFDIEEVIKHTLS
ncbi:hypothetical protein [Parapedobacter tibetensis]|uniref:hypothetical protein n=1 Tax=Parapedobacter tibetensis TaxID=2972951 RepID=UPI00214D4798|nr:hypothetical protein [Parapedobacter tibetensis]